jgi:hypothetical protein
MGDDDVVAVRFRRRSCNELRFSLRGQCWERRDLKGEAMGIEMKV